VLRRSVETAFSAGHDTINESVGGSGSDTVLVRDIYDPADIDIFFDTLNNLQMVDSDGNEMTVYRQGVSSGYQIEHIVFGDSTDRAISSIEVETRGTSGADNFDGQETGDASSDDVIYGYDGNDTIRGGTGDDVIYGGNGADALSAKFHNILYGDDGNDTLTNVAGSGEAAATLVTMYGGDGADTFYAGVHGQAVMHGGNGADTIWCSGGGSYSDTIVFDAATAFDPVDVIKQFTATTGHDKIDISDVLDGHFNPSTDVITNFVQITTSGSNSEVYVDTTGTATFGSAQHIATIEGVTGLTDEAALVTAGTLLAA
jgi:Ca2+-binding RTX toxin-like protein